MEQQRSLCSFSRSRSTCCRTQVSTGQPTMCLSITSTTGSLLELTVPQGETVEGLRTHISKKLGLQTDRIVLLHRDRQLTAGKLLDLGVTDGSKLTLVPVIEAGLACSTARTERNTMDVLDNLTEVQISDFLSGRSPLTVKLGVGAHVMYVQLQLSAQNVSELQQNQDVRAQSNVELPTTPPTAVRKNHPKINTPGQTISPASQTSVPTPVSLDFSSAQRHRSLASSIPPAATCHRHPPHRPSPQHSTHPSSPVTPNLPSASACPQPSSPPPAATPVCRPKPITGPQSPTPASSIEEGDVQAFFPAETCKQPGAVIDSLVSHSPGVFSGTFSGTLTPGCLSGSGVRHPRRGVTIILQILSDLLRAAYNHQGGPLYHLHCPASNGAGSLLTTVEQTQEKSTKLWTQTAEQLNETLAEESATLHSSKQENHTLHHKLEHLQLLMHERRLHRRTRRTSRISQTSHPYRQHHHRS